MGEKKELKKKTASKKELNVKDVTTCEATAQMNPLGVERQQEVLIRGLLEPKTLLDVIRTCAVFKDDDGGKRIKILARYQQYRAVRKIIHRLRTEKEPDRRSGVIWHTQGAGKSLTMVFVIRELRLCEDLKDYKVILVNDRVDLEDQLSKTATLAGETANIIHKSRQVKQALSGDASDLSLVMVHKFKEYEGKLPHYIEEALLDMQKIPRFTDFGVVNPSDRVLIMVDEAHRTQASILGDNLFAAFPNATRIAFTGTPIIKNERKRTTKRFGEYIDQYKLMEAVDDNATLQILYEGKTADVAINQKSVFDEKFVNLFRDLSGEELLAVKKRYGVTGDILEAEKRIEEVAADLVDHYVDQILPNGFKAQVVGSSKIAAVRYQKSDISKGQFRKFISRFPSIFPCDDTSRVSDMF